MNVYIKICNRDVSFVCKRISENLLIKRENIEVCLRLGIKRYGARGLEERVNEMNFYLLLKCVQQESVSFSRLVCGEFVKNRREKEKVLCKSVVPL